MAKPFRLSAAAARAAERFAQHAEPIARTRQRVYPVWIRITYSTQHKRYSVRAMAWNTDGTDQRTYTTSTKTRKQAAEEVRKRVANGWTV